MSKPSHVGDRPTNQHPFHQPTLSKSSAPIGCEAQQLLHHLVMNFSYRTLRQMWHRAETLCRNVRSKFRYSFCLQFILSIAFCSVLHRLMSRVIHRTELSRYLHTTNYKPVLSWLPLQLRLSIHLAIHKSLVSTPHLDQINFTSLFNTSCKHGHP